MSVDHLSAAISPLEGIRPPTFLSVKPGDHVIVQATQQVAHRFDNDWWMGQVIFCEGDARDPKANTMFQIANVDDGHITWINGDEVTHVVRSLDGMSLSA